jgi:hypothetical protein
MERYQRFPKLITIEDWLAMAHPDATSLPWVSDGREVCSLTVRLLEETGGILVILFDAHCREVIVTAPSAAIAQTVVALGAVPGELTFLPAAIKMKGPRTDGNEIDQCLGRQDGEGQRSQGVAGRSEAAHAHNERGSEARGEREAGGGGEGGGAQAATEASAPVLGRANITGIQSPQRTAAPWSQGRRVGTL